MKPECHAGMSATPQQPEVPQQGTCPDCNGKGYVWRGKNRVSCLRCNATGVTPVVRNPKGGYFTK